MRIRRTRRQSLYNRRGKRNPLSLFLILGVIGFIFWAIFQVFVFLFSSISSESSSAEIKILKGRAEFLLPESRSWSLAFSEQKLWPNERFRTNSTGHASLTIFENNILFLGPNTELQVLVLEENSSKEKTVQLQLIKGNIWVKASSDDFKNKNALFEIQTTRSKLNINGTIFDIEHNTDNDVIRLIKGSVDVSIADKDSNFIPALTLGVGQKITINNNTQTKLNKNETLLSAIDPEFIESAWHIKNLKTFYPLEATAIQQRIKKNEPTSPTDSTPSIPEGNSDIESPKIISPKEGIKIPASEDTIKIKGTVALDIFQVEINGFALTKFTPGDKKWTYFAASKFGTLVSGENKFSVVAISRDGKRSIPTVLTVFYEGIGSAKPTIIPSKPEPTKKEILSSSLDPQKRNFPAPIIISPKSFDTNGIHKTAASIITIKGTVKNTTRSIEINGFELRKFKLGNTNFSYIANAAYGNMRKGLNNYQIVAHGPNGTFSETNIKIQYTPVVLNK